MCSEFLRARNSFWLAGFIGLCEGCDSRIVHRLCYIGKSIQQLAPLFLTALRCSATALGFLFRFLKLRFGNRNIVVKFVGSRNQDLFAFHSFWLACHIALSKGPLVGRQ